MERSSQCSFRIQWGNAEMSALHESDWGIVPFCPLFLPSSADTGLGRREWTERDLFFVFIASTRLHLVSASLYSLFLSIAGPHTHSLTHSLAHAHTHAGARAHTHTHSHTHTQTLMRQRRRRHPDSGVEENVAVRGPSGVFLGWWWQQLKCWKQVGE